MHEGNPAAALALITAIESRGEGTPLVTYLKAHALAATGQENADEAARLAETDTSSLLGVTASAALIATGTARRGEDPRPWLERVPAGSRYASRARHMAGIAALERGDSTSGAAGLGALAAGDSNYAARREVWLALAGQALDEGRWESAHLTYRQIDQDWAQHRDVLKRLLASADHDSLWRTWEANSALSPALMLDALPARMLAEGLADASEDLSTGPSRTSRRWMPRRSRRIRPGHRPARPRCGFARPIGPRAGREQPRAGRDHWAEARERESRQAQRYQTAASSARREAADLAAHTSLLDSLEKTLADLDARLEAARDGATQRIIRRTMDILEACIKDLRWMQGIRHFHLEGPNRERAVAPPEGYPSPDSVMAGEESLARAVQAFARRMAGRISSPARTATRPGVIDRAAALDSRHAAYKWARWIEASVDSGIAATATSAELARLAARADALARAADALRAAHEAERAAAAREAIARATAELEAEREGIDYGLAASAYGIVRLGPPGAADTLVPRPARARRPVPRARCATRTSKPLGPAPSPWTRWTSPARCAGGSRRWRSTRRS
jgi:hypothetical protein